MKALLAPLAELADYEEIRKNRTKENGMIQISGCVNTQKIHLLSGIGSGCGYKLVVFSNEEKAKKAYEEYLLFGEETYLYPARDLLFYYADIKGKTLTNRRMEVLRAIAEKKKEEPVTVITTMDAFLDGIISPDEIQKNRIHITGEDTVDLTKLEQDLTALGYERESQIEAPGQFAVRGGIIDVFPLAEEMPVRIELWGDEIDSIRMFDAKSQRSIENISEITIYPASENCFGNNGLVSFLKYFPENETLLFYDEPHRLQETAETVEAEYTESLKNRADAGMKEEGEEELRVFQTKDIISEMNRYSGIGLTTLESKCGLFKVRSVYTVQAKGVNPYNNSFELLTRDLKRLKRNGYRVVLLSGSRTRAKRLAEDLRDYDLSSFYSEDMQREVKPGEIMAAYGYASEGYEYPMLKFVVISESDIFGRKKKKKKRKKYEGQRIQDFAELKPGDYVVHENHGIGVYKGIEKIEVEKIVKDYMKIVYAEGGVLYIPVAQMDLIQKYAGADAKKPRLNKLGTIQWGKTKSQVKKAVQIVAKDLVELYAVRQQSEGFVYGPDTVWQKEFEEMFPYEETDDQLNAIQDTKNDMESARVMDRLICGDVGYGKTEVAIRAAFKAIQDGKQVAYLVPTTVLASQHYSTFAERMKGFPVNVGQLSSFRTSAQNKKTIEELKSGMIDVVIGTHRILSKDVKFKDLGLLIIDEEQRFGVTHKEKIKELKNNIDVLTLSATPIPRTLHMSLVGIRDMSVLEEPPVDRHPIQTFVTEHNDEMIREAITRELARNGQVYYVYNKVRNIEERAEYIQNLVPDAVVAYAHGQMDKRQLEKIMYQFVNGEIDVLVSTTIIETGMDIPNCNTMVIENADQFGLSQLYQLRGRVGRSTRTSYAFLMYKRDKMISEVAEKRLSAIKEFSDLGSGFKIAMKDLEIRGAGNVLGKSQHGHMAAVGYDLYCKMLNQAVNTLKGVKNEYEFETTVDMEVDAYIPATYIRSEYQKLDIYKRIAALETREELSDMKDELMDRYGSVPSSASNLLMIALIKMKAHKIGIMDIKGATQHNPSGGASNWRTVMTIYPKADINSDNIPKLVDSFGGALEFKLKGTPEFVWTVTKRKFTSAAEYLEGMLDMMDIMEDALET